MGKELGRCEAKIAAPKHGGREAVHDGLCLHVKIAEHFIGSPPPDHAETIAVDAGAVKRHSAADPSGPDRDVREGVGRVGMEVEDGADAGRDI